MHIFKTLFTLLFTAEVNIKEQLKSLKHTEGETATMHCKVTNPKNHPVKWFKDGKEIVPDNR